MKLNEKAALHTSFFFPFFASSLGSSFPSLPPPSSHYQLPTPLSSLHPSSLLPFIPLHLATVSPVRPITAPSCPVTQKVRPSSEISLSIWLQHFSFEASTFFFLDDLSLAFTSPWLYSFTLSLVLPPLFFYPFSLIPMELIPLIWITLLQLILSTSTTPLYRSFPLLFLFLYLL